MEEAKRRSNQKFKKLLGKRLVLIVTGGAPTSPVVIDWLRACFQIPVSESYGSSEVGGIFTNNKIHHNVGNKEFFVGC